MKASLFFITPIYPPVPGGGSQYSAFLVKHLPQLDIIESMEILTEFYPGEPVVERNEAQSTTVRRKLVRFASLSARLKRRYFNYVIQNIQLIWYLSSWLFSMRERKRAQKVLMIHGAYLIHPSILISLTRLAKRIYGNRLKIIFDLRDPSAPMGRLSKLCHIDLIITCGRRITESIRKIKNHKVTIEEIPIPLEETIFTEDEVKNILDIYSLKRGQYLFNPNGINDAKGFSILYDAWKIVVENGYDLELVIAGHKKDWKASYEISMHNKHRLVYIGSITNKEVRMLMKGAAAVINPSQVESISRTSLEALSVHTPVLLPPYIPEFEKIDQRFVVKKVDPKSLARQIEWLLHTEEYPIYDLSNHYIYNSENYYKNVFDRLLN